MSEVEQEQTEEQTEEETPAEGIDPNEGAVEEPDNAAQPEPAEARDDREIEVVYTRLEKRASNYVKSVSEILDGSGVPVTLCEMCSDAYPGIRWTEPRDEVHASLVALVGATGGESPLVMDKDARECDRCEGYGWTRLPSHVPENQARLCRACNGAGYVEANPQSGSYQAPQIEATNGTTDLPEGVPENDPSVIDLRARGYMVMPIPKLGLPEQPGG